MLDNFLSNSPIGSYSTPWTRKSASRGRKAALRKALGRKLAQAGRCVGRYHPQTLLALVGAVSAVTSLWGGATAPAATYVWTSGATGNWNSTSTSTAWLSAVYPNAAGAIVQYNSTTANATTTLNTSATVGQIVANDSGRLWTIAASGTNVLTLDNTSGSTNGFGNANAAISISSGVTGSLALQINPGIVIANTDLDIGSVATNSAGITLGASANAVGITATSTRNLTFRNNSTTSGAAITVNDSIGVTGSTINILNAGTGTLGTTLTGILGSNVGSVTQNSASSVLTLSGANLFTGGLYINRGTVNVNNSSGVMGGSSGTVYLGDISGTSSATLQYSAGGTGSTHTNPINIQAGNTGTITINDASGNGVNFNGLVTLNGGKTLNITNGNTGTSAFSFGGGFTGTGNLAFGNMGIISDTITLQTNAVNMAGTITNSGNQGTVNISAAIGSNVTGVTQSGGTTSVLQLSGDNSTYTGGITVTSGAVSFANTSAKPATGMTTAAAGATLGLGMAGAGAFSATDIANLFNDSMSNVTMASTSLVGIDTSGGNYTYTATLGSTTKGLAKLGGNTLTLTGAGINYTGGTTIYAGTLQLGNGTTGNDPAIGSSTVTNYGTLAFNFASNQTATYSISGSGAVTKLGTYTLTLSGTNTYSGATTISAGTLKAGSSTALGSGSAVSIPAGATLDLNGNSLTIGSLVTGGTGTITDSSSGTGVSVLTISGNLGTATGTLITDGATQHVAVKASNGNGIYVLNNSSNTFSGGLYLTGNSRWNKNWTATGTPGALTSGYAGVGTVYIGQNASDAAQIFISDANVTIKNAITVNSSAGTDVNNCAFRIESTGNILSGLLTANLAPATFGAYSLVGSATITGQITGSNGLSLVNAKTSTSTFGNKTVTVTLNSTTPNDYAGDTSIVANYGILVLGSSNQIPNGAGKGNLVANGTFNMGGFSETINGLSGGGTVDGVSGSPVLTVGDGDATQTFSGVIKNTAGSLKLVKMGTGVQTLSGADTYSGGTAINGGILQANHAQALGTTGTITFGGGTLQYSSASAAAGAQDYSSRFKNNTNAIAIDTNSQSVTLAGVIDSSNTGGLNKSGSGTLILSNTNNGYLGTTTVSGGALAITAAAALPGWDTNGRYSVGGGMTLAVGNGVSDGDIATMLGTSNFVDGARIGFDTTAGDRSYDVVLGDTGQGALGLVKMGSNTLTLTNTNTYTGGTTVIAGTLKVGSGATMGSVNGTLTMTGGTLDLNGNNVGVGNFTGSGGTVLNNAASTTVTLTIGNNDATGGTHSGVIGTGSGTLAVSKVGAGILTLSGTNTYTGGTTISGGTLNVTSAAGLGSGVASIDSGSTLQFSPANGSTTTYGNKIMGSGLLKLNFTGTTAGNAYVGDLSGFTGTFELANTGVTGNKWSPGSLGTLAASLVIDSGSTMYLTGTATFTSTVLNGTGNNEARGAIRMGSSCNLGGPVYLGSDSTLGTEGGQISGNILSGATGTQTLTIGTTATGSNATFSGNIGGGSGTVALTIAKGTQTLLGTNTYTGVTTIASGAGLQVGNGGTTGDLGNSISVANSGTLTINRTGSVGIASDISGTGVVTKSGGTGTATLDGLNSYSGNTTVSAGKLFITNGGNTTTGELVMAAGGVMNLSSFSDYGVASAMGNRALSADTTLTIGLHFTGGTLQYTGDVDQSTNRQIRLSNNATNAIDSSGVGALSFTNSGPNVNFWNTSGARTLTLTGSNTNSNTFAINIQNYGGNATSLVKSGEGTWIVSNSHNSDGTTTANLTYGGFTGGTTVNGGTLVVPVAGALGSGNITVSTGTLSLEVDSAVKQGTIIVQGTGQLVETVDNAITGSAGLTVNGATVTLDRLHAYTGATTLSSGTLNLSAAGAISDGIITVSGTGQLVENVDNAIGGTAGLTINGPTVTLSRPNAYTGNTLVSAGTLRLTGNTLLNQYTNVTVNSGGTFAVVTGDGTTGWSQEQIDTVRGTSGFVLSNGSTLGLDTGTNGDFTYSTGIAGSPGHGLSKLGANTLVLSGVNTYTGPTKITGGTLQIDGSGSLGGGNYTNTIALSASTALNYASSVNQTFAGIISGAGTVSMNGSGSLTLSAANTFAGPTYVNSGSLVLAGAATTTNNSNIVMANGANLTFSDTTAARTFSKSLSGSAGNVAFNVYGNVSDSGGGDSGLFFFTNTGTFTGTLLVNAGTVAVPTSDGSFGDASNVIKLNAASGASSGMAANGNRTTPSTRTIELANAGGNSIFRVWSSTTWQVDGSIIGLGNLVKTDGGTLKLTGANTYTGTTRVGSGTINLANPYAIQNSTLTSGGIVFDSSVTGKAFTFGGLSGAGNIALQNNGSPTAAITLSVGNNNASTSHSGVLSGAGGLTKIGTGTLTLTGANTYTGGTAVNDGTLAISGSGVLANNASNTLTINSGGTVTMSRSDTWGNSASGNPVIPIVISAGGVMKNTTGYFNTLGPVTLNGGTLTSGGGYSAQFPAWALRGTVTVGGSTASTISSSGTNGQINLGAGSVTGTTFNVADATGDADADLIVSAILQNGSNASNVAQASTLTKSGAGTLTLSGINTYTGNTTVSGGTLKVTGQIYTPAYIASSVLTVQSGGVLELQNWAYGGTNSLGFLRANTDAIAINGGTIRVNGSDSYYRGFTMGSNGATLEAGAGATWTLAYSSTAPIANSSNGALTLTGSGNGVLEKTFFGSGGLTKSGAGRWTLSSANTYTGATNINGGTLSVNGSLANTAVAVNNNGTLGGTGTIAGAVTVNSGGHLAPGNSPGALVINNTLTLSSGSVSDFEIASTSSYDQVTGLTGLSYGGTLNVTGSISSSAHTYTLFSLSSGTPSGTFDSVNLAAAPTGYRWHDYNALTAGIQGFDYTTGQIQLELAPVATVKLGLVANALSGSIRSDTTDENDENGMNAVGSIHVTGSNGRFVSEIDGLTNEAGIHDFADGYVQVDNDLSPAPTLVMLWLKDTNGEGTGIDKADLINSLVANAGGAYTVLTSSDEAWQKLAGAYSGFDTIIDFGSVMGTGDAFSWKFEGEYATITVDKVAVVPEPGSLGLLGLGALGLMGSRRRRSRKVTGESALSRFYGRRSVLN